jgi:hypothetical protein
MATSSVKPSEASAPSPKPESQTTRPAVKRRPRRRDQDPIPVTSGRYNIALGLILAMVLIPFSPIGRWVERKGPGPHDLASWVPGAVGKVRVTVVTGDYDALTCESGTALEGAHCAYKSQTEVWPNDPSAPLDDNKVHIIQPYRTTPDNKLVLIAGLWANPAIAMRLHREPPNMSGKKLIRFVASCDMKFIGKLEDEKLRWNNAGSWQDEGPAMVARPTSCQIEPEE